MYLGILWHKWALSKLKFSAKSHNLDGNLASVKKKKRWNGGKDEA